MLPGAATLTGMNEKSKNLTAKLPLQGAQFAESGTSHPLAICRRCFVRALERCAQHGAVRRARYMWRAQRPRMNYRCPRRRFGHRGHPERGGTPIANDNMSKIRLKLRPYRGLANQTVEIQMERGRIFGDLTHRLCAEMLAHRIGDQRLRRSYHTAIKRHRRMNGSSVLIIVRAKAVHEHTSRFVYPQLH